jgi:hypothetical protein
MKTNATNETLLPASSVEACAKLSIEKYYVGNGWTHFILEDGGRVSLRCSHEEYRDNLEDVLTVGDEGKTITLPEDLPDIVSRAVVLMDEMGYDARVSVSIASGYLLLTSRGDTGWFKEKKKIDYKGERIDFDVHPNFLVEVLQKTREVVIGRHKMKLEVDGIKFVATLQDQDKEEDDN